MENKKLAIRTVVMYMVIMYIGVYATNHISGNNFNSIQMLINSLIIQIISLLFIIYVVKNNYVWESVGFNKIKIKNLIWFTPYIIILLLMIFTFIKNIYQNYQSYSNYTWTTLIIVFIGTVAVGFSEEVMFRGILLNSFKTERTKIKGMVLGSLGFSIIHIINIFLGASFMEMVIQIISTSLLGFSFVSLAIKLNNIWPIIIFHSIWNFVIMSSKIIGVQVSIISVFCNPLNLIIGTILWVLIIKEEKLNCTKIEDIKEGGI